MTKIKAKDYSRLRRKFDSDDPFLIKPRIINTAGATSHAQRTYNVPAWALDNEQVKRILLRSFPKLNEKTDAGIRQCVKAARWIRVIQLYFRVGWTEAKVAAEMNLSQQTVHGIIRSIRRVRVGTSADGKRLLGSTPRGRPRLHPRIRYIDGHFVDDNGVNIVQ